MIKSAILTLLATAALTACSPTYNWRDYSSQDAPYRVMFPDKPSVHKRSIDIGGATVEMTMTAVDVDGAIFAVGSAQAPDAAKAQAALASMKTALVNNIGATVTQEKTAAAAAVSGGSGTQGASIDMEATGARNGVPMKLIGHFESRDKRFYQVIVMGKASKIPREQADQFLSSFKLL
ncbi:hypothetical protein [Massilia sp. R2A-15]|uniref:hypothetical protein n=1 Tax=Massilia sp. R2A-15 TaxID=3064278 RepID=UPI0028062758|nr:hypothetical protein [Massilia sp. R2A-15]